jgi:hypothetical protein
MEDDVTGQEFPAHAVSRQDTQGRTPHEGRSGREVRGGRTVREGAGAAGRPFLPAGWPSGVLPPGAEDWEQSATAFLLDCCPADFRGYPVLRRHPVVLAQFAAQFVASQVRASEDGLARARLSLRDQVEPPVVEEAVRTWQEELVRLRAVREGIALVDDALRGMAFVPRL